MYTPGVDNRLRLKHWATLPSGARIYISMHAIERFDERAAGGIGLQLASERVYQLVCGIGDIIVQPDWLRPSSDTDAPRAEFFVALGEDLVLPLLGNYAPTLLAKGGMSDRARARRNDYKRSMRGRRWAMRDSRNLPQPYHRSRSLRLDVALSTPVR